MKVKIRTGFVSNSSSSSFIIGANTDDLETVLYKNFKYLFPADNDNTKTFIEYISCFAASDLVKDSIHWSSLQEFETEFKVNRGKILQGGVRIPYNPYFDISPFFEKWNHVFLIDIPTESCGGTALMDAMNAGFPEDFKNDDLEITLYLDGN